MNGVTHKLYIHAQTLEFYQYGTNPTFIFQLSMWTNPYFYNSNRGKDLLTNQCQIFVGINQRILGLKRNSLLDIVKKGNKILLETIRIAIAQNRESPIDYNL